MKKNIIVLSLIFLFTGCAQSSFNDSVVRQSEPIFIDTKPKNSKTYISFRNSSKFESNLMDVLQYKLLQNGYEIVANENMASVIMKLELNYFRRNKVIESSPTIGFGVGSGSHWGFGYGVGISDSNNNYSYDAQLALKLSIDNGKKIENYISSLDYQNTKGYNSTKTLRDDFDEKISDKILRYLEEYQ